MEMIFLNKYSAFYLVFTFITGVIAYLATNKVIVGLFVVLFVMNFIFFLTFLNATDEEVKDAERRCLGEDSDKNDDKN